jgi:hypothetical protein
MVSYYRPDVGGAQLDVVVSADRMAVQLPGNHAPRVDGKAFDATTHILHADVATTMIYTPVLRVGALGACSPLDRLAAAAGAKDGFAARREESGAATALGRSASHRYRA